MESKLKFGELIANLSSYDDNYDLYIPKNCKFSSNEICILTINEQDYSSNVLDES